MGEEGVDIDNLFNFPLKTPDMLLDSDGRPEGIFFCFLGFVSGCVSPVVPSSSALVSALLAFALISISEPERISCSTLPSALQSVPSCMYGLGVRLANLGLGVPLANLGVGADLKDIGGERSGD